MHVYVVVWLDMVLQQCLVITTDFDSLYICFNFLTHTHTLTRSLTHTHSHTLTHTNTRTHTHSTKYGMYKPNCGLKDVMISYGHDEYLYQVLTRNNAQLPEEAMYCIRYHSFYPWHTGGAYDHLCDDKDRSMLKWIREFK